MVLNPNNLPLLVSLHVLLEERNVTRAATRLHLSQPALSAQLSRLRRLFKDPLLVRSDTGRGMVPTPRAEQMAGALREALQQLSSLGDALDHFDPRSDAASFRVGGSFSAIGMLAQPLIRSIRAHDNCKLRIAFRVGSEDMDISAQFENGEIDVLLAPAEHVPPFLKVRRLIADRMMMVQRVGHPRGNAPLTLEEYCSLGHLMVSPSGRMHGLMDEALKKKGRSRHVLVSVPNAEAIHAIVTSSNLVCTLPQSLADSVGPGVETYSIPLEMPDMTLAMAWHNRLDHQPAHRWLRDSLVSISLGLRPGHPVTAEMDTPPAPEHALFGHH